MRPMFAEYPGVPGLDSFDEFMKMVSKILALYIKKRITVLCSLQLKKNSDKAINSIQVCLYNFRKVLKIINTFRQV